MLPASAHRLLWKDPSQAAHSDGVGRRRRTLTAALSLGCGDPLGAQVEHLAVWFRSSLCASPVFVAAVWWTACTSIRHHVHPAVTQHVPISLTSHHPLQGGGGRQRAVVGLVCAVAIYRGRAQWHVSAVKCTWLRAYSTVPGGLAQARVSCTYSAAVTA
jgi:hypothetical protein